MGVIVAVFLLLCFMIINVNVTLGDCIYYNQCSNDLDCSETCISDYDSLELYVQNNKTIINDLTKAFFSTGHSPARFVRITYKFQIPFYINDSDENDTYSGTNENDTCSSVQRLYYWSASPIYLLGPKPLMCLTLFAVIVQEENVIIELPCLQANNQKALLSRLTYLV